MTSVTSHHPYLSIRITNTVLAILVRTSRTVVQWNDVFAFLISCYAVRNLVLLVDIKDNLFKVAYLMNNHLLLKFWKILDDLIQVV
jgi:hypothetical protein